MNNHIKGSPGGVYRSRDGLIFGLCRGIARRFNISVFWVRVITIVLFISFGFWPVGLLYLISPFIFKLEPSIPFGSTHEQEFYDSYTHSRTMALDRLKRIYQKLNKRLARMESIVTSRDYEWEQKFRSS